MPEYSIVGGNPAKVIMIRFDKGQKTEYDRLPRLHNVGIMGYMPLLELKSTYEKKRRSSAC